MTPRKTRTLESLPRSPAFDKYLKDRGITDETADACGFRSLPADEHAALIGHPRLDVEGGLIPFFGADRVDTGFFRTRAFGKYRPRNAKRDAKFLQIAGQESRLYIPLNGACDWREVFRDPSVDLHFTEGEFKAAKACQEGMLTLGITGVSNFSTKDDDESDSRGIRDLDSIEFKNRNVYVINDSDAATNPNVQREELRFAREIFKRGGRPYIVRLPRTPGLGKTGLDDFFVRRGKRATAELRILKDTATSPFVPTVHSAAEIVEMKIKPVAWAIKGLLPCGASMLAARPKMGKSFLGLQASHNVATGSSTLGSFGVEQAGALYLALEDTPGRIQLRMKTMRLAATPHLRIATSWPRGDDGYEALIRYLEENPGIKLVVIDTWQKFRRPPSGRNLNAYQEDYAEAASLKAIADRFGIAILIIHHLKKGAVDDVFEGVSGTTGLTGAMDTIMVLHRERTSEEAVLHITGRDISEQELAMQFGKPDCLWKVLGPAAQFHVSRQRSVIVDVLRKVGKPMRLKDLAEEVSVAQEKNCSPQNARKMLRGLIDARTVEQNEDGLYQLGASALAAADRPKKF
jgi:hypothetical protein